MSRGGQRLERRHLGRDAAQRLASGSSTGATGSTPLQQRGERHIERRQRSRQALGEVMAAYALNRAGNTSQNPIPPSVSPLSAALTRGRE